MTYETTFSGYSSADLEAELTRRKVLAGEALKLELRARSLTSRLSIRLDPASGAVVFESGIESAEIKAGSPSFLMLQQIMSSAEIKAAS